MTDRNFFLLAVMIYGVSMIYSVFLWRKGFREDERLNSILLAGGLAFHTIAMVKRGFSLSRCPVNNLHEAMMFIMWNMVIALLVLAIWPRLRFFAAFASPAIFAMGVFALMPGLDIKGPRPDFATGGVASLHASLILLSYGAFGLGSIAAAMYLTEEHDLKVHRARALLSKLPPIERLERITTRALEVGFALLTAGLAMAPWLLQQEYGVWFKHDAKILWSIFVWFLYAGLLVMRWWFAQRGRRFAWGTVGSFSFVLLTFWGVNLLSRVHHP